MVEPTAIPVPDGQAPARRVGACVAVVVVLLGCLCLVGAWLLLAGDSLEVLKTSWYLQTHGETTTGQITSIETESSPTPGGNTVRRLVVDYTVDGVTYTVKSRYAYGSLATYKVGDTLDVIYDTADPTNAQVDLFLERWLDPILSALPF